MSDVTMPTLAEMERHATLLVGPATPKLQMSMDDIMTAAMALHKRMHRGETPILLTEEAGPFTTNVLLEGSQLSPWGVVPVSPHIARITALEADVARLLAENVRLAAANAVLQRGAEIIAAADKPEPRPAFPASALARQHQAIGMTCGI